MKQLRIIQSCLTGLFLFISLLCSAQICNATLCGIVTDADTHQPIPFAEVIIEETGRGEITDEEGRFHFHDLCEGKITVVCRHIGCAHVAKAVVVEGDVEVDFELHHHAMELGEIVVREAFIAPSPAQAQRGLSGDELAAAANGTLGDILEQLPGVNSLSTGASIDKPVIRGLHSNRVLLLNNGVRQEGQQWGQEHAPEIDPTTAGRMTVVMGANSVRYGAEALGGVVLVEPEPLRQTKGLGGTATLGGNTNGRSGLAAIRLDAKPGDAFPLSMRFQGSLKRSGNLTTPDYFLENSGIAAQNFHTAAGLKKRRFESEISYTYFKNTIGILEASHAESPTELAEAIERGRPESDGEFGYAIQPPNQEVSHQTLRAKTTLRTGESGKLTGQYAFQLNNRLEFEEHDEDDPGHDHEEDEPATELGLRTHTADLAWEHKPRRNFTGSIGTQLVRQHSKTHHGDILPDFNSTTAGVFWTEHWRKPALPVELEMGIRYDLRRLYIDRQGDLVIDKNHNYNNLSGTLGAIYKFTPTFRALFHLGSAWRSPTPNELYSNGVHHGAAAYEQGRDDLVSERAYSANLTLDLASEHFGETANGWRANISIYQNEIADFIYLQPQNETIETDDGVFPVFRYRQSDVRLRGLDWQVEWMPATSLVFATGGAMLRTMNRDTEEPLALMPADRFRHSAQYNFKGKNEVRPHVKLTVVNVAKQRHFPEGIDLAPPPGGYTLLHFTAGGTVEWQGKKLLLGLTVNNFLNTSYRNYLNRFRYFAGEPGRDIGVLARLQF